MDIQQLREAAEKRRVELWKESSELQMKVAEILRGHNLPLETMYDCCGIAGKEQADEARKIDVFLEILFALTSQPAPAGQEEE